MKKSLLTLLLLLTSCADTDVVRIDQSPDVYYVTNNITEEYLTEITQIIQSDGLTIVELIQPCKNTGYHAELILKLSNGQFLAYFTTDGSALNARLTTLVVGQIYTTTDQYRNQCKFKITNENTLEIL